MTRYLGVPFPLSVEQLHAVNIPMRLVALLGCLGLATPVTVFLTGFINLYLTTVDAASGTFNHEESLACQVLILMAFAPGIQSFSLDRFLAWAYRWLRKQPEPFWRSLAGPAVPVWPVRFILLLLAVVYFTAGVSKVRFTGWRWLDGQTLTYYVSEKPSANRPMDKQRFFGDKSIPETKKWKDGFGIHAHHYGNYQSGERERKIADFLIRTPGVMALLSVMTIIFEMGAPVLLLGGWYRNIILVSAIALHRSIALLMGIPFYSYQAMCLVLLDWPLVLRTVARVVHAVPQLQKLRAYLPLDSKVS